MFDIGASELLIIVIVAIVVIGPGEMPRAMRTAGQWIARIRKVSGHFRAGLDAMVREAELAEMEKEWKERNAKIMAEHPETSAEMEPLPSQGDAPSAEPATAEARAAAARERARPQTTGEEPQLPLDPAARD
ncbi:Sec-independent protein translocase protein TatB [Altererythrobacter sp. CAU 1778]